MKAILLTMVVLFVSCIYADNSHLILSLKSGRLITLDISDAPKITFKGGVMQVGSEQLLVSNISKYWFGSSANGIEQAKQSLDVDAREASKGIVTINGYDGREALALYKPDGVQMPINVTVNNRCAKVEFSALPAGVYILMLGEESLKIFKR